MIEEDIFDCMGLLDLRTRYHHLRFCRGFVVHGWVCLVFLPGFEIVVVFVVVRNLKSELGRKEHF